MIFNREFLRASSSGLRTRGAKRKMAIEVLPNNRDVVLELDAEKMVRVINNLLSNAIKYGHEDSVITMEVLKTMVSLRLPFETPEIQSRKKYWNNSLHVSTAQKHPVPKKPVEQDLVWRLPKISFSRMAG